MYKYPPSWKLGCNFKTPKCVCSEQKKKNGWHACDYEWCCVYYVQNRRLHRTHAPRTRERRWALKPFTRSVLNDRFRKRPEVKLNVSRSSLLKLFLGEKNFFLEYFFYSSSSIFDHLDFCSVKNYLLFRRILNLPQLKLLFGHFSFLAIFYLYRNHGSNYKFLNYEYFNNIHIHIHVRNQQVKKISIKLNNITSPLLLTAFHKSIYQL